MPDSHFQGLLFANCCIAHGLQVGFRRTAVACAVRRGSRLVTALVVG
jgi:hypothetical protein